MTSIFFDLSPNIVSMVSFILFNKSPNFLAEAKIPPPARPANISPIETLSVIHVKTFSKAPNTLFNAFDAQSPISDKISPKPFKPSTACDKNVEIPEEIFDKANEKPLVSNPLFIETKKSPITAITSKRESAKLSKPLD